MLGVVLVYSFPMDSVSLISEWLLCKPYLHQPVRDTEVKLRKG